MSDDRELCGNDAHYGYDGPPQVPFVYNQDPCFNQDFDNNFPQTSPSFPQQYLCCENYKGPHATFQCQPVNQNFYNSNSFGFDQIQTLQYPVIHHSPQETSVEILETPKVLLLAWEKFVEIQHAQPEDIHELLRKLLEDFDDVYFKDIDYVEASPPDSELVSLEESPSPFPIPVEDSDSFFEKSDTFLSYSDNSLPEFKTFSDHTEETSSGSTTTHADNSLPEYDSFLFEIEPDQGELSRVVMETILGEPRVYVPNVLPAHPTLYQDSDFSSSDDSLGSDLEISFSFRTRNKIFDPGIFLEVQSKKFLSRDTFSISFIRNPLCPLRETLLPFSSKNEDKVFNPRILSPNLLSHRGKITFDFYEISMMISGGDIPSLDVLFLHFYPP
nr:hypothetical protein [Tanacetum cinerariifolium]